jgi:hypothetical protein
MGDARTKPTAGELSLKAARDETKYDPYDVGHGISDEVMEQIVLCAHNHHDTFDEPEYCIVMLLASDCLLNNLMRLKYYAWPYLPSPRPNQSVFLYNKHLGTFKFLWSLPKPEAMAMLNQTFVVQKKFKRMKQWCDAFYDVRFWEFIREQHKIDMLSESEYLAAHRQELIQAGCKEPPSRYTESFDFAKVMTNKI